MFWRIIGYFFALGVMAFFIIAAGVSYVLWSYSRDLPDYAHLKNYEPPVMTRVHAADGQLVAEYATERRLFLPIQAIPDLLIAAYLSAEDKNFYSHPGIDPQSVVRAVVNNVENFLGGRRGLEGASTITQQVAKNFLLSNEQSFERKIKEALVAFKLEQAFTKDQILELYLNEIYLGIGAYGVAAASLNYFDKSVHELSIAEAAYLAALPKAPNNYHPARHTQRALERRNWVISQMHTNGYITADQADAARQEPLAPRFREPAPENYASGYFTEDVRRNLVSMYGNQKLLGGGLSVRTTLNPQLQVQAREALVKGLVAYDRRRGWRGAVEQLELASGEDWGQVVSRVQTLRDIAPWRAGIILSVGENSAELGLQPERNNLGVLSEERRVVTLRFSDMRWAWPIRDGRQVEPRNIGEVLSVGDVVYASPMDDEPGVWELQQVPELSGAIVAMEPNTGRVVAMVGGFSFDQSEFNRASQAMRQPGSSFKPFVYAAALDNLYTPSSVVMDAPIEIDQGPGLGLWRPQNYSREYYGPSTLRRGIELSRNVMTVRLARDIGMPVIVEYARRFGIYDNMMPVLSMSLGAGETTVLRMTNAYAMLANGGKRVQPTLIDRIQDRYGRTIFRHDQRECVDCNDRNGWRNQSEPELLDNREQVLDPLTAYQMTSMMEGVVQRGTATTLRELGHPIAGKTGTTNDGRDVWFVGYSPNLVVGVYLGFDRPRPLGQGSTGGGLAAPIFKDFMAYALRDQPPIPFNIPAGMQLIRIDPNTGLRAGTGAERVIVEAFKPGTSPPDSYSVIGFEDEFGRPLTVSPDADRAVISGTGGLY